MKKEILEEANRRYPKSEQVDLVVAFTEGAEWASKPVSTPKSCDGCVSEACVSCQSFNLYQSAEPYPMTAEEFITMKNNGKTPEELFRDGEHLNAVWVVSLLKEFTNQLKYRQYE
jgi:hypothetical protein